MLLSIPAAFTATAKAVSPFYPPFLVVSAFVGLVAYAGIWMMKKWGVLVFTGLFVVNNIALFAMGQWNALALVLPIIFIALLFWKYKLMA